MILTAIGAFQFVIGALLLLFGTVPAAFLFVVISGLFMGSAAVLLPVLGGSSIPPVQIALIFLALRVLVPGSGQLSRLGDSIRSNLLLIAFAGYGIVGAVILPRLFENQIDVVPMRVRALSRYESMDRFIYATQPLTPTSQNLTTAIYIAGTMLLTICAHVAMRHEGAWRKFVKAAAVVALVHAALGVLSVLIKGTPSEVILEFFRNGSYAQLDHVYRGFVRMTGISPEASGYGTFGVTWFVFNFECWLRGVQTRWTGPAALVLLVVLAFSTSSLAYLGLMSYAAFVILRTILFPGSLRAPKIAVILIGCLILIALIISIMIWQPALASDFGDMIRHFTVDKQQSVSGRQRSFWAWQGYEAFVRSYGLGIGPGSFRSSSNLAAIIGAMGIIGITSFTAYLIHVFKPLRLSTYMPSDDPRISVAAAAAWACVAEMMTAVAGSPTPDPGPSLAIFAGVALGLRNWQVSPQSSPGWRQPYRAAPAALQT